MPKLDWSKIKTGATFESLASLMVRHDDPQAHVYDRLGKDAAIDIKSSDGKCVYQAKYIGDGDFGTAITHSLKELKKINKYRKPSHSNSKYWDGVYKWCLITNATKNPSDKDKWIKQVVTEYKKEGSRR